MGSAMGMAGVGRGYGVVAVVLAAAIVLADLPVARAAAADQSGYDPGLPLATAESAGMSTARLQRIGPVMQRYIDRRQVAGTVTVVARRGKVVHVEARGRADVERDVAMTPDTLFRIASMTKPVTSVALMMLWEEGAFQLEDPVAKYLPEFAAPMVSSTSDVSGATGVLAPATRVMTIRHLLTHTAGLANSYRGNPAAYQAAMAPVDGERLDAHIARLARLPLNYEPGTRWEYSAATDVVGRLVEVLSGQPLDAFLQQRIFAPLGMHDTAFWPDPAQGARLAAQYKPADDGTIVPDDPGGARSRWMGGSRALMRGAGGLVSTAHDYLRFAQAMLAGGELDGVRLLGRKTVELMFANHTGDLPLWLTGPGHGFGLGFAVVRDRGAAATPQSEGTTYWGGAFCTTFWIDRDEELVAMLFTQVRPYTHLNIRSDFRNLVYQAVVD